MARYYVDLPFIEAGHGAVMHCHDVVEAENVSEAQKSYWSFSMNNTRNSAILLPDFMQDWPKEKILDHYEQLQESIGDEMFYKEVMHSINPYSPKSDLERLIETSKIKMVKAKSYLDSILNR